MSARFELLSLRLKWAGAPPCLFVLATALIAASFGAVIAYSIGKTDEDKRRFLVNYRDPTFTEFEIEFAMDYVLNSTEKNDFLFHGDSTCLYGVNVNLIEDQVGLKAFNLGSTAWIGWAGFYLVLERYLECHPKPKLVVFCINPAALSEQISDFGIYQERLIWSFGSGREETRPRHADGWRHYVLEGIRTFYESLSPGTRTYRGKEPWSKGMGTQGLIADWTARRGSLLLEGQMSQRLPPEQLNKIEMTPNALEHLKKLAAITRKHDILLVIRLMPVWQGTAVLADSATEQMRQLELDFGNLVISRPEILNYDPILFFDNWHLNSDGVSELSSFLAVEIKDVLRRRKIKLEDH